MRPMSSMVCRRATLTLLLIAFCSLVLGSCSDSGSSGRAELNMTFAPNPVPRSGTGDWSYRVYLAETKNIGVTVLGYTISTYSPNGAFLDEDFYTGDDFDALFGCDALADYIPAGLTACSDSITITGSACYKVWRVSGRDDRGNYVETSGKVTFN